MKVKVKHSNEVRKIVLKKKKDDLPDFFKNGIGRIQAKSSNRSNLPPGHK